MKKFSSISKVAAAAVLGSVIFVGCGGDSSSTTSATSTASTGLAKYIQNATVFLDENKNGILDNGELSTVMDPSERNGKVTIPGNAPADYNLVFKGGTNTETNASVPMTFAPKGYAKASPLTTMIAGVAEGDRAGFLADLGLTVADLNLDYSDLVNNGGNLKIGKILAMKTLVEASIASSGSSDIAGIRAVAVALKTAVNSNVGDISGLINALSAALDITIDTNLVTTIEAMDDLNVSAGANPAEVIAELLATAEKANALNAVVASITQPTYLDLASNVISLGAQNITLINDTFVTYNEKLSADENLTSFFDVSFDVDTSAFVKSISKTADLKLSIVDDQSRSVSLTIHDIVIATDKGGVFDVSVPAGSVVEAVAANLEIAPISVTTTKDISLTTTNGKVEFDVNKLIEATGADSSSETLSNYVNSLNTYAQTANSYTVSIGYMITNEMTDANKDAILADANSIRDGLDLNTTTSPTLAAFDANISAVIDDTNVSALLSNLGTVDGSYTGFTGTINIVNDITTVADSSKSSITASKSTYINATDTNVTITTTMLNNEGTALSGDVTLVMVPVTDGVYGTGSIINSSESNTSTDSSGEYSFTYTLPTYVSGTNYVVKAKDSSGFEFARMELETNNLPTINGLTATPDASGLNYTFTWNANDEDGDALSYDLFVSGGTFDGMEPVKKTTTTSTTCTLVDGEEYYITVKAEDGKAGEGIHGEGLGVETSISVTATETVEDAVQVDISGYTLIQDSSNNAEIDNASGEIYVAPAGIIAGVYVSSTTIEGETTPVTNKIIFNKGTAAGSLVLESEYTTGSADCAIFPNNGYITAGATFAVKWDDETVSTYTFSE